MTCRKIILWHLKYWVMIILWHVLRHVLRQIRQCLWIGLQNNSLKIKLVNVTVNNVTVATFSKTIEEDYDEEMQCINTKINSRHTSILLFRLVSWRLRSLLGFPQSRRTSAGSQLAASDARHTRSSVYLNNVIHQLTMNQQENKLNSWTCLHGHQSARNKRKLYTETKLTFC